MFRPTQIPSSDPTWCHPSPDFLENLGGHELIGIDGEISECKLSPLLRRKGDFWQSAFRSETGVPDYIGWVRVHLGSVEGTEVEDGSEEPFTPFSFSFSTLTPFLGGNSFFPLLAFLFLFLSSFSTPSLLNMCCLSPCDVHLKFWFFWACLSVYGSQFELL